MFISVRSTTLTLASVLKLNIEESELPSVSYLLRALSQTTNGISGGKTSLDFHLYTSLHILEVFQALHP